MKASENWGLKWALVDYATELHPNMILIRHGVVFDGNQHSERCKKDDFFPGCLEIWNKMLEYMDALTEVDAEKIHKDLFKILLPHMDYEERKNESRNLRAIELLNSGVFPTFRKWCLQNDTPPLVIPAEQVPKPSKQFENLKGWKLRDFVKLPFIKRGTFH
jgi:hypothetical protein